MALLEYRHVVFLYTYILKAHTSRFTERILRRGRNNQQTRLPSYNNARWIKELGGGSTLGKREIILVLFVRLFGLCLFGFVVFLLGSGKACGL